MSFCHAVLKVYGTGGFQCLVAVDVAVVAVVVVAVAIFVVVLAVVVVNVVE